MKLVLQTQVLKELVSRSIKGAGNNKLIPITGLMSIELKDSVLTLITTDATNYLYVKKSGIVGDDFYAVVDANQFSKLISKMTSDTVILSIKNNIWVLEVTGNGNYRLELPLHEDGKPIIYPDPYMNLSDVQDCGTINKTTVQVILETLKPSLAVTLENPCYTAYYMGNRTVATDGCKIADMDISLLDEPALISSEMMDLLSIMTSEIIDIHKSDNTFIFETDDCIVLGRILEGIEEFAIDAITELVNVEYNSFCKVSKNELLQLLDRLALFVGPYDNNAVCLTFTNAGLQVSSLATSGVELIPYIDSGNFINFTCSIDINMLINEVKAIQNDIIELYYGDNNAIKLVDGNITLIVALLEEEEQ